MLTFLSSLSVLLALLASSHPCAAQRTSREDRQEAMIVTLEEHAKHLEIDVGEEVIFKLDCIPGTGYSWQVVASDTDLLEPIGVPFFEPKPDTQEEEAVGSMEYQVFYFRGKKAGTTVLELHYARQWDEEEAPARVFTATVEVQAPPKED